SHRAGRRDLQAPGNRRAARRAPLRDRPCGDARHRRRGGACVERSVLKVPPLRIALLGDGRWAASSLARLRHDGHTVVLAVVRRRPSDDTLAAAATAAGVPVACPEGGEPALAATLADAAPDLLVSIAYDR